MASPSAGTGEEPVPLIKYTIAAMPTSNATMPYVTIAPISKTIPCSLQSSAINKRGNTKASQEFPLAFPVCKATALSRPRG